jgi:outer membrane protein OmpA-like peptidoglycan-associated protein
MFLTASGPVAAQAVLIGGDPRPDVQVDNSVLESLGKVPTLPDLLLGGPRVGTRPLALVTPAAPSAVHRGAPIRLHPLTPPAPHKQAKGKAKTKNLVAKKPSKPVLASSTVSAKAPTPVPAAAPETPSPSAQSGATQPSSPPAAPEPTAPAAEAQTPTPQPSTETKPAETRVAQAPAPVPEASAKPAEPSPPAQAALPSVTLPVMPPPDDQAKAAKPAPASPPAAAAAQSAPAVPPPAEQQAKLPPASPVSIAADGTWSIGFDRDDASLANDARAALSRLAGRMAGDANLQVQLLAYAEGTEDTASKARRLSLSRALAVRSYLIDQGVRSTRIEVRALGNKVPEGNPDRVDVIVQKR